MSVAVVIVTYHSADTLPACLDALAKQTLRPSKTLVIDNASPMGFPSEALKGRDVETIRNSRNIGFAAANNQALSIIGGDDHIDLVALLNRMPFRSPVGSPNLRPLRYVTGTRMRLPRE